VAFRQRAVVEAGGKAMMSVTRLDVGGRRTSIRNKARRHSAGQVSALGDARQAQVLLMADATARRKA